MDKKYFELTNPQKSIWNSEMFYENTNINNIPTQISIHEKVDTSLLIDSINNTIKKNDGYRIQIDLINGKPMQYFADFKFFSIDVEYAKGNSTPIINKVKSEIINHKFQVLNSPLYYFKIVISANGHAEIIFVTHHIISDSWSLGVFAKNLMQEYCALLGLCEMPPENYSYAQYIETENTYKESSKFKIDKNYWKDKFLTIPESTNLSTINQSNTNKTDSKADRLSFVFDSNLVSNINNICSKNKVSVFNFIMGIYSLYVNKITRLDDFVLGTPILNRSNYKEKQTIGMFVNTIPIRFSNFDCNFAELIKNISINMLGLLKHQKYSYMNILEMLRKETPNISSLYNIIISYQITKAVDKEICDYTTDWFFTGTSGNDLAIHILDINDTNNLVVHYDYLLSKFSRLDIEQMHNRIINIINQVLSNIEMPLKNIEIVTRKERNQILFDFNNTEIDYPKKKNIIELFEMQVKEHPNDIAVVYENEKLTYKELNNKANSLAYYIKKIESNNNTIIGIILNKSIESIISILAILKSGNCFMPIDIDYSEDRIRYMLENSKSSIVITNSIYKEKLENIENLKTLNVDNEELFAQRINILNNSKPDDLAYIMYTSGSTGNPKGVMVSHKNIIRLVKNNSFVEFGEHERILQTGSLVFDACTFEIWGALLNGFELYIIPKEKLLDPLLLEEYLVENKITILWITAPLLNQLCKNRPQMFSHTKYLLTGGDILSPKHINLVRHNCPNLKIINGYGPTENTTFSTCFTIDKDYDTSIPIGYPISNSTCYIVSKDLSLLPIGYYGELIVGGDGVSKGYINDDNRTKESFIDFKYSKGTVYKTGDLARWLPDGSIEFAGRIDNQVKIRGFRVELDEINLRIQEYTGIRECVSIVKEINNEKLICSYFSANTEIKILDLKEYLSKKLPSFSIPSFIMQIEKLPINTNGKIDRKLLPELQSLSKKNDYISPRNEIDQTLIDIIKKILSINKISITDSFFDIGGDSLSSINLSIKIQNKFNKTITVKDIFNNPIIKDLSDLISEKSQCRNTYTQLVKALDSDYYKVSSAQKRMYLSSKMSSNGLIYNIPFGIVFEDKLDLNKLENAIKTIIKRHDSLRTHFEQQDTEIIQKVESNIPFKLEIKKKINYKDIDKAFKEFVKPFDLSSIPLFRFQYIDFTDKKSALFMDFHHIIFDGASMSIIANELSSLYNGKELKPVIYQYKDYSSFENEFNFEIDEKYWLQYFSEDIPTLDMPTTFKRPTIISHAGDKIISKIDKKTTSKIYDLCQEHRITPFMFLISCYYILLSKYSSNEEIIVGLPVANRDVKGTHKIVGMFVNTLALKVKINNNNTFEEFLESIKDNVLACFNHQNYPFDMLVNKLGIRRDSSRSPLFDTAFIYQNYNLSNFDFNNIKHSFYIPDIKVSKYDFSLEVLPNNNELQLSLEYATSLFSKEFMEDFSKHYKNIINVVLNQIDIKLSKIAIISDKEKNIILNKINDTDIKYEDKTLLDMLETNVLSNPEKPAIIFENKIMTYKELNEKANCLANCLIQRGITSNDTISILLKRSFELIISIYASLKAGCRYVIIDTDYPAERINYILNNSNSNFTITYKNSKKINWKNVIDISKFNYEIYNNENSKADNNDNLCIIYTSGSTGNPKGVIMHQHGYYNLLQAFDTDMQISSYKNILSIANITFDMFTFEVFCSISFGNTLILANEEEQKNPISMSNLIKNYNVDYIITTPSRIEFLLKDECQNPLTNVKAIVLGGEIYTPNLYNRLSKVTKAKLYNSFGPTEITSACTNKLLTSDEITVGKPLANNKVYICDKDLNLLPIGIVGEICVGGKGVTNGYLNNEKMTKEHFVSNPFYEGLLFKTGDLGKYNSNGELEFINRADNQIKLRGLRIELGEIENLILKFPGIEKAVVVKQELNGREFLSSYLITNKKISITALRKHLSTFLPKYMVPSYYTILDKIPYTSNGKIDRKNLPIPKTALTAMKEDYELPKTRLENQLVSIWENILDIKPIGIHDNFFELGGDSLLAMNLNVELLKITDKITYADIFSYPTIFELEKKISTEENELIFKKMENLPEKNLDVLNSTTKRSIIKEYHPKNILLTGATGFLGIHILDRFLSNETGIVYCIVRDEPGIKSELKLKQKLNYYFGNKYDELFGKRIILVTGNILDIDFGLIPTMSSKLADNIDLVIHSAAIVTHFGNYNDFYRTNVQSTKYIIDYCKKYNKKLYYISTTGVSGTELDSSFLYKKKLFNNKTSFNESSLYIGQILDNVYMRSKFEAENFVLNSITDGLDAYILRMGNLMPRYSDGVFQENILDNAFLMKIASFIKLGIIPEYMTKHILNFTPVDYAAEAIYKIVTHTSSTNRVFHLYNNKNINVKKYLKSLKNQDMHVDVISEGEFISKINEILKDNELKNSLNNLIDDFDKQLHLKYVSDIITKSRFTTRYLQKVHFSWPKINASYLDKFNNVLRRAI